MLREMDSRADQVPVAASYADKLIELLDDIGIEPTRLESLRRPALRANGNAVTFSGLREILGRARTLSGEPALGLLFGRKLQPANSTLISLLARAFPTLESAMPALLQYLNTQAPLSMLRIESGDETCRITLHEQFDLGEMRISYLEAVIAGLLNALHYLTGQPLSGARLSLAYPAPAWADSYVTCLNMPIDFLAGDTALELPAASLRQPLPRAQSGERAQRQMECARALQKLERSLPLEVRLRQLFNQCEGDYPSLDESARLLNMSPRTLRRKLATLGTTYQKELDDMRCMRACHYLRATSLSVRQVAARMGYGDPSNFGRAFRGWTGLSPGALRQRNRHTNGQPVSFPSATSE